MQANNNVRTQRDAQHTKHHSHARRLRKQKHGEFMSVQYMNISKMVKEWSAKDIARS